MGPPFRRSPLDPFVSAAPSSDITSTSDDVPSLAYQEINTLREKSIRKLYKAIDEIILRYEGDGDEEADDVVDLDLLEVIEDRGRIRLRFGSSDPGSQNSHEVEARLNTAKRKQSAVDDGQAESTEDLVRQSDATQVEADDEASDSDSVIFLSSSHSWCSSENPPSSVSTRLGSLAPFSDSTTSSSEQRPLVAYPTDSMTNALFERLKKRVKERAADIRKHRLMKLAAGRSGGDHRRRTPLISHTSHTSQIHRISRPLMPNLPCAHLTLSPTSRLTSALSSSTRAILGTDAARPPPLVDATGGLLSTPATTRTATCTNTSFSSHPPLGESTSKKRHRDSTLPSSPYLPPYSSPQSLSVPSTSSSREKAHNDSCRKLIKPTRLFQNQVLPFQTTKAHQKSRPKSSPVAFEQEKQDELDRFSRESSEDPLYLPPSTSKSKTKPHPPRLRRACCTTPTCQCEKSFMNSEGMEGLDDELALKLDKISSSSSSSLSFRYKKSKKSKKFDKVIVNKLDKKSALWNSHHVT